MSLLHQPRYSSQIQEYFKNLPKSKSRFPIEQRYESILNIVSELWVDSDKNPSIFKDVKSFEPLLQRLPNYRDHFIHSFNVFLMGYYLINRLKELDNRFSFDVNTFNLTWMLASTFHDVAYPLQEIDTWLNEFLEKFIGTGPKFSLKITDNLPLIYHDIMRMISSWHSNPIDVKTQLDIEDWDFHNIISSNLVNKNHGVLGGLMLAYLLAIRQGFATADKWGFLLNHRPACHAICVHHLKSIQLKLSRHPFAFILSLCDELQDWGRPSQKENKDDLYLIDIELSRENNHLNIQISVEASEVRKEKLITDLSNLRSGERIKLLIMDSKGKTFFEMPSD